MANLVIVLVLGATLAWLLPNDIFDHYIRFVGYGCAGGSGGLAQSIAAQMNRKAAVFPANDSTRNR